METTGSDVIMKDIAFCHPSALIYGKVELQEGVSVWPYTVIRSEMHEVVVGPYTNLQDFVMIHVGYAMGTHIGSHCSITHRAVIHGAKIGDNCLIGPGAILMDGVEVGENSIVAGGSFLKEGTIIPPNSIVVGTPGKVVRTRNSGIQNRMNAMFYFRNAQAYAQGNHRAWSQPDFGEWAQKQMEEIEKALSDS